MIITTQNRQPIELKHPSKKNENIKPNIFNIQPSTPKNTNAPIVKKIIPIIAILFIFFIIYNNIENYWKISNYIKKLYFSFYQV